MDEQYIIEFIEKISPKHRARKIKDNLEFRNFLDDKFPDVGLNHQIYSLLNKSSPFCICCNHEVKSYGKKTCSFTCSEIHKKNIGAYADRLVKSKKTWLENLGIENPAKSEIVQKKRLNTMEEVYGSKVSPKSLKLINLRVDNFLSKGKQTLKENFGVDNPGQIPNHYSTVVDTMNRLYGVDHYSQIQEFKNKREILRNEILDNFSPNTIRINNISDNKLKQEIFDNPNKIVNFLCTQCNSTEELPTETFRWRIRNAGTPCLKCSGITKGSLKETEIRDYIISMGIEVQSNVRILDGKEIDIFIPSKNIGIEFHGLFWHNDLRVSKDYHKNKLDLANKKNIRLIQIFEDEWEHKKDIVKSRLKNLLGLNDQRIYARNCKILEVVYKDELLFLENNHIQGYSKSSVKIGLYYNDILVSLMTFSKPNLSKGGRKEEGAWELLRFTSSKNIVVIGAASKLFKYFLNKYNPIKVISYSDSRWNTGKVYELLGFDYNGDTGLGYWYIDSKNVKRLHRFSLRKNKDDNQDLTEYQNRLNQGYLRIWDCGNSKWIWNFAK